MTFGAGNPDGCTSYLTGGSWIIYVSSVSESGSHDFPAAESCWSWQEITAAPHCCCLISVAFSGRKKHTFDLELYIFWGSSESVWYLRGFFVFMAPEYLITFAVQKMNNCKSSSQRETKTPLQERSRFHTHSTHPERTNTHTCTAWCVAASNSCVTDEPDGGRCRHVTHITHRERSRRTDAYLEVCV